MAITIERPVVDTPPPTPPPPAVAVDRFVWDADFAITSETDNVVVANIADAVHEAAHGDMFYVMLPNPTRYSCAAYILCLHVKGRRVFALLGKSPRTTSWVDRSALHNFYTISRNTPCLISITKGVRNLIGAKVTCDDLMGHAKMKALYRTPVRVSSASSTPYRSKAVSNAAMLRHTVEWIKTLERLKNALTASIPERCTPCPKSVLDTFIGNGELQIAEDKVQYYDPNPYLYEYASTSIRNTWVSNRFTF